MKNNLIINHIKVSNLLEDLGNDVVFFTVQATINDIPHYTTISFYELSKFCNEHKPEIAAYFSQIRKNISGFGPKETKVWAMLQDEDFDIKQLLYSFFEHYPNCFVPVNNKRSKEEQMAIEASFEQLKQSGLNMKKSTLRNSAFKDDLLKHLSEKVLENFPEIFESTPAYIMEVKEILFNHIENLSNDLSKLAYKARNVE